MLLGEKTLSPADSKLYSIDYSDWLDDGESVASMVYTVSYVSGGNGSSTAITVTGGTIASDGQSVSFFVNGNGDEVGTVASVNAAMTSTAAQVLNDTMLYEVVSA